MSGSTRSIWSLDTGSRCGANLALKSQSKPLKMAPDHVVALAGGVFEAASFQHANTAISAGNEAGALECSHHQRYRRPLHTEHDGEEFML